MSASGTAAADLGISARPRTSSSAARPCRHRRRDDLHDRRSTPTTRSTTWSTKINDLGRRRHGQRAQRQAAARCGTTCRCSAASRARRASCSIDGSGAGPDVSATWPPPRTPCCNSAAAPAAIRYSSDDNQFRRRAAGARCHAARRVDRDGHRHRDQTGESAAGALQTFVDNYNKLRDKLDTYTAFDLEAGTKGTLFGSSETLRIDAELSRLVTGRYFDDGEVRSLAELGVSIDDQGNARVRQDQVRSPLCRRSRGGRRVLHRRGMRLRRQGRRAARTARRPRQLAARQPGRSAAAADRGLQPSGSTPGTAASTAAASGCSTSSSAWN